MGEEKTDGTAVDTAESGAPVGCGGLDVSGSREVMTARLIYLRLLEIVSLFHCGTRDTCSGTFLHLHAYMDVCVIVCVW